MQFLSPPTEGEVEVETLVEKSGRTISFLSGRMRQGGKPVATAVGAFSLSQDAPEFDDTEMPHAVPFDEAPGRPLDLVGLPEIAERFDTRYAVGYMPMSDAPEALTGGWMRLMQERPMDHLLLTLMTDGWLPSAFIRANRPIAVPTVDLTIHFRVAEPEKHVGRGEHCLVAFRSRLSSEGFVEEDGEIWSRSGKLLVQSRQLAVVRDLSLR